MTEEAFLRYRMAVIERMPDSPSKRALIIAVESRMAVLKGHQRNQSRLDTDAVAYPAR